MASRAVFSFLGFPGWGPLHLRLDHEGYLGGAALHLGAALTAGGGRAGASLVRGFLKCHRQGEPLGSPELCRDCTDRYLIVHRPGGRWPLRISAWRRRPGQERWVRRCGPMPLADFLRRFHPCRHQRWPEGSDARHA